MQDGQLDLHTDSSSREWSPWFCVPVLPDCRIHANLHMRPSMDTHAQFSRSTLCPSVRPFVRLPSRHPATSPPRHRATPLVRPAGGLSVGWSIRRVDMRQSVASQDQSVVN